MTKQIKTPWGGGLNSLKPSRFGFTLAEVLITLAIIGIVAALTIPTLVAKNEKKQFYTQFMKTYNTLSNALTLAMADNGDPITWKTLRQNNSNYIEDYILPYVKGARVCEKMEDCFSTESVALSGASIQSAMAPIFAAQPPTIQLPDGASIVQPSSGDLVFDTNGLKGPNRYGSDVFFLILTNMDSDKSCSGKPFCFYNVKPEDCFKVDGIGPGCALKILKEGKIDF